VLHLRGREMDGLLISVELYAALYEGLTCSNRARATAGAALVRRAVGFAADNRPWAAPVDLAAFRDAVESLTHYSAVVPADDAGCAELREHARFWTHVQSMASQAGLKALDAALADRQQTSADAERARTCELLQLPGSAEELFSAFCSAMAAGQAADAAFKGGAAARKGTMGLGLGGRKFAARAAAAAQREQAVLQAAAVERARLLEGTATPQQEMERIERLALQLCIAARACGSAETSSLHGGAYVQRCCVERLFEMLRGGGGAAAEAYDALIVAREQMAGSGVCLGLCWHESCLCLGCGRSLEPGEDGFAHVRTCAPHNSLGDLGIEDAAERAGIAAMAHAVEMVQGEREAVAAADWLNSQLGGGSGGGGSSGASGGSGGSGCGGSGGCSGCSDSGGIGGSSGGAPAQAPANDWKPPFARRQQLVALINCELAPVGKVGERKARQPGILSSNGAMLYTVHINAFDTHHGEQV
jgi:hypothetical protein